MNGPVDAMAVRDAGGEQTLFAGGSFTTAGGVQANRIAQWDGSSWAPLGSGMDWVVSALVVHDDGGGPALYVGGGFGTAGGVTATRIAKWDGATWSSLGAMHLVGRLSWVLALTTFDDGNGSALYAGGDFTSAGGVPANYVAKWDGSSWSALGSGMNSTVKALVVLDDGSGPALYAGGTFTSAGGVAANRIARWDGTGWSALGDGMNNGVEALAAHDDGSGRALFAGGSFTVAGGVAANRVARWDGTGWSALGSGMNGSIDLFVVGSIKAFVGYDDGTGSALIAGGLFTSALDSGDSFVAKWSCPVVVEQCVQGLGHWKTHACDWPAPFVPGTPDPTDADGNGIPDDLEGQCGVRGNAPGSQCPCDALHTITIGSIAYDQCELLCSLAQPVQGNALRLLARHLIAAKLNVLNGASDEGVVQASCAGLPPNPYDGYTVAELIAAGDNLIATGTTDGIDTFACAGTANCPCPAFPANILTDCVPTSAAHGNTLGPAMTAVAQLLELYSEGCGGVPRCVPAQFLQDEHEPRRR
jgi:hypothetical protein